MNRRTLAALAMPIVTATVLSAVLSATHHLNVSSLSPTAAYSGSPPAPVPCKRAGLRRPFAGVATNPQITAHVEAFRRATGARITLVEYYNPFTSPFQRWEAAQATGVGAMPLIQLNPRKVSLAQIAAGRYDGHIRRYADAVRNFRCRIAISFGHEMNGWWYSWGLPTTTPATYIAAWRHIHDVFAQENVRNVVWSWDPSHLYRRYGTKSASPASEWYPGDRYVDWIGIDGYLRQGQTFGEIFSHQLRNVRGITSKPVYLAETGVAGSQSQSWQIAQLFGALRRYDLVGLVWFDLNRKQPWRLEGRPAGLAAYRKASASLP